MLEFSDFWGVFDPPDPHRQKFKILARQSLTTMVSEVSRKIWLKSVVQIWRIFAEKKRINCSKIESHMLCVRQLYIIIYI